MERSQQAMVERGLRSVDPETGTLCDTNLAERMAELGVPGMSVAVLEHGEIAWAAGYGVLEAGGEHPVTTETHFQAASISKAVSALAALRLVDRGTLELDRDVNEYLREWRLPFGPSLGTSHEAVTLRQLLSHTAGTTVQGFPGYAVDEPLPTLLQILNGEPPANTEPIRVNLAPGSAVRYSSGGYCVLQQLLVEITGQPFPDLMYELVLEPLDMAQSTFRQPLPPELEMLATTGHRANGGRIEGKWYVYPEMAAAGLWTTPSDLLRFAQGIRRGWNGESSAVLSRDLAREMLTPQRDDAGLGLFLSGEGTARRCWHNGANQGFRGELVTYVEQERGAAVMANSDGGDLVGTELLDAVARTYGWPSYADELRPQSTSAPILDRYAGEYELDREISLIVERERQALRVQIVPLMPPFLLVPVEEDVFASPSMRGRLEFRRGASGEVKRVVMRRRSGEIVGTRRAPRS